MTQPFWNDLPSFNHPQGPAGFLADKFRNRRFKGSIEQLLDFLDEGHDLRVWLCMGSNRTTLNLDFGIALWQGADDLFRVVDLKMKTLPENVVGAACQFCNMIEPNRDTELVRDVMPDGTWHRGQYVHKLCRPALAAARGAPYER